MNLLVIVGLITNAEEYSNGCQVNKRVWVVIIACR